MDLFTVSMEGFAKETFLQLCDRMTAELERLHMVQNDVGLRLEQEARTWTLSVGASFSQTKNTALLYKAFGRVMSEFMMEELWRTLIRERIRLKYRSFADEEREKLERYCEEIWMEEAEEEERRELQKKIKHISRQFRTFVEQNRYMHLTGFIRFRLQEYMEDLDAIVEYAADELLIDRQYREFITILKYFVCSQEIKRPAVHIYHQQGSEFVVLDEKFQPIDTRSSERLVVETVDKEINLEDMIISTLITVSPQTVYIHTNEPDMQVIRTIRMIFEERAVLCT